MDQDHGSVERWADVHASSAVAEIGDTASAPDWADLRPLVRWLEQHRVVLLGTVLIAASVIWKAAYLSHLYFRQDDFRLLDRALTNPLDWSELTFVGAGHLIPGPYLVAWLVVRISFYNWGLACAVSLAFVTAASFAALRLLRTLFGDRAGILIPLTVYLLCPLTLPDLGIWSSALESVPLQLATFMAVNAQVHYVKTERPRHLIAAASWVVVGLLFFEKGLIVPLLLFGISSAFLMGDGSWWSGARRCAARFWKAWLLYGVLIVAYSILLKYSLRTSVAQPGSPGSVGRVLSFVSGLLRETFLPGAIGGPWHWYPVEGGSYAFSAPVSGLMWISWIVAALVVLASILFSRTAWRAWAILLGWLIAADMLPVIVGRVSDLTFDPVVLGLESRYVADAVPVLAICIGLAFWPLTPSAVARPATAAPAPAAMAALPASVSVAQVGQVTRTVAAVAVGAFVVSSLWSVQAYQDVTLGAVARTFITNARLALRQAPRGTQVLDTQVPPDIVLGSFGSWALASTVVGDMARGGPSRLRWITTPYGTFDHLMMFGTDGRLHLAQMYAVGSPLRRPGQNCWAVRGGQVRIPFFTPTQAGTTVLRFGYLWYSRDRGLLTVDYGGVVKQVIVDPGLHGAYLPERGSARSVVISGFGSVRLCVGDAEAGILVPSATGPTIPATNP